MKTLTQWAAQRYETKPGWTERSLRIILIYTGLVEISDKILKLSERGAKYLESDDPEVVLDALIDRIWGIREIVFWLKDGADVKELLDRCNRYGVAWRKQSQIIYRLQWLMVLGMVKKTHRGYVLTELGYRKMEEMAKMGLKLTPLTDTIEAVEEKPKTIAKYEAMPSHNEIQQALLELGNLEGYEVAKEYPIDDERLDVAWWRKVRKRPDIIFEVQRAGDLYAALTKLKEAWDLWECRVVLVTSKEYIQDAERWLKRAFHEMEKYSRIILWSEVEEWLQAARVRNQMKKKLGLDSE